MAAGGRPRARSAGQAVRHGLGRLLLLLCMGLWLFAPGMAPAQSGTGTGTAEGVSDLRLEASDGGLYLSAALHFELPPLAEDALLKGISIYFVEEAEVAANRPRDLHLGLAEEARLERRRDLDDPPSRELELDLLLVLGVERGEPQLQHLERAMPQLLAVREVGRQRETERLRIRTRERRVRLRQSARRRRVALFLRREGLDLLAEPNRGVHARRVTRASGSACDIR